MKKFEVSEEFWTLFPQGEIFLLVAKGINNHVAPDKEKYFADLLKQAAVSAQKHIEEITFTENIVIKEWRQAFTLFKTKKGARSSIEALLKRVSQDREFSPISPLVDLYNSISLRYGAPCGGEDLDQIQGDLRLGLAKGGESFRPLGAEEDAPALPGEVVYFDDQGAICRCFNWREAQRTMLREDTKNAVLVIEAVNARQALVAKEAAEELKKLIEKEFDVKVESLHANKEQSSVVVG